MFFSRKYKLSIPEPCQQGWDKMLPSENGRFCTSCAKTVVDFTGMSEKQIAAHFRDSAKQVCGRIESRQMERTYEVIPQVKLPMHQRFWGFIISLFVSGVSINKAAAQSDTINIAETDTLKAALTAGVQTDSTVIANADTVETVADSAITLIVDTNQVYEPEVYVLNIEHMIVCGGMQAAPVEAGPSFLDLFRDTLKRSFLPKGIALEKGQPAKPKKPEEKSATPIEAILAEETKRKGNKRG